MYLGPKYGVIGLRNQFEKCADGSLQYVKLAPRPLEAGPAASDDGVVSEAAKDALTSHSSKPAEVGQFEQEPTASFLQMRVPAPEGLGFGQWCRLATAAEEQLIADFKSVDRVAGCANSRGVEVGPDALVEEVQRLAATGPLQSNSCVVAVDDVQDRMPFGLERKMRIHTCTLQDDNLPMNTESSAVLQGLPYGLPAQCNALRQQFSGCQHSLGIVPHINEQQFVVSSGCKGTWVRFDQDDLQNYEHNLDGIPSVEDDKGILFPVTHLWVDFNFPTAKCAFEWFCGTSCLARREISLWPLPTPLFKRLIRWAVGKLRQ